MEEVSRSLYLFQKRNGPTNNFTYFAKAEYCKPVEEIFDEFGYPDKAEVYRTVSGRHFYVGRISLRQIVLTYKNNAKVLLTRKSGRGWCLMRSLPSVNSMGFDSEIDNEGKKVVKQFRLLIWEWSMHGINVSRFTMKENPDYRRYLHDEAVLRVWWGKDQNDDFIEDGLTILLKEMKKNPSARYRTAMHMIVDTAKSGKIKRNARSYLKKIPEGESDEYIPSIEMMRLLKPVR